MNDFLIKVQEYVSEKKNGSFATQTYTHHRFDILLCSICSMSYAILYDFEMSGPGGKDYIKSKALDFARDIARITGAEIWHSVHIEKTKTYWHLEQKPELIK